MAETAARPENTAHMFRRTTWAAYAACGWALLFALMSFYWAAGGNFGVETLGSAIQAQAHNPGFVAIVWLTGVAKVIGGLFALTLVRPWALWLPRRLKLILAWTGGIGLALAACSGPAASSGGGSSGVVNITWQTMWSGNTLTLLQQMISQFNATHPGIHVTEANIPSATGDAKLQSEIAAGDPPDVFTEWNPVLGQYAANGEAQSLAPYLTGKYAGLQSWLYPIAQQGGDHSLLKLRPA